MILGVGVDLLDIGRIVKNLENPHFMARVFSEYERQYIASRGDMGASSAAGIFAAKEAFTKAAGEGFAIPLGEVTVEHSPCGQPRIVLTGGTAKRFEHCTTQLSITHTATVAAAFAVIENREE